MDRILITGLEARCTIGVDRDERREKQEVLVDIALSVDLHRAGRSDHLEDSVDYRALKKRVMTTIENSDFRLIEALAEAIAAICLEPPLVRTATVRVEKPGALRFARSVGTEVTRERPRQ